MTLDELGLTVDPRLIACWRQWFAPDRQPFVVSESLREDLGGPPVTSALPLELQDTFCLYGETVHHVVALTQRDVRELPPALRRRLLREQVTADRRLVPSLQSVPQEWRSRVAADSAARRFVWWSSTLQTCGDEPLLDFVRAEAGRSDHGRVLATTWARAEDTLPGARRLAGTFADASGPNCFGTVMAAAGVPGASRTQVVREPFERWLADSTRPGGDDDRPGTVLVWRDQQGAVQHAAVTLGDGWALHKPSQGWMTARVVLPVREVIRAARQPGHRLTRRTIAG